MTEQYDSHIFSGGEVHVTLRDSASPNWIHRIENSDDLVRLAMLRDAWNDVDHGKPSVTIPYFPYARQDRVCNEGEAHSLRVFCNMLKSMDFASITTYDIHSDVAFALLDNLVSIPRCELLINIRPYEIGFEYDALVSPDAGALKHCYDDAEALGIKEVITATKVRDLETREIIRTEVNAPVYFQLAGKKVLITDDICDGGRTFLELAKVLKEQYEVEQVDLFVTHGIFMNGLTDLAEHIDNIYTTDTRSEPLEREEVCKRLGSTRFKVIKIVGDK